LSNIRKTIVDAIITDLTTIKTINGYSNDVKFVEKKYINHNDIKQSPGFSVTMIGDVCKTTSEGNLYHETSYALIGYMKGNQDKIQDVADSLYQDVLDLFKTRPTVDAIKNVESSTIQGMAAFIDDSNLNNYIIIELKITYYED
jgi:hypothetical protein